MDDDAGRYPTGKPGLARDWDGHAWVPQPVPDPTAPAVPKGGHFVLRTLPFWIAVVLVVVGAVIAGIAADAVAPNRWLFAVAGLVACGGALIAMTVAVWRRLRIGAAIHAVGSRPITIIALGIASGVLAVVLAFTVETVFGLLGAGEIGGLFLAGPIEEVTKLLLPVILFYATRKRWGDPRVALGLAWISGVTFGVAEGGEYLFGAHHDLASGLEALLFNESTAVLLTISRTFTELMHPLLTGAAAAVMWLGAWRGKHLLAGRGLLALLTAAAMHSFNDGVIGGLLPLLVGGLWATVIWPLWLVAIYQVFRRHVRELLPPSMVASSQPRWRPHVKAVESPAPNPEPQSVRAEQV